MLPPNSWRTIAAALVLALASAGAAMAPRSAGAAAGDLACQVPFVLTFDPPLTSTNSVADVALNGTLLDCFSANGQYSQLASGMLTGSGQARRSALAVPCSLLLSITGTAKVRWNTGQESTLSFSVNTDDLSRPATLGFTATVTDGPLEGDAATATPTVNPNPDCALNGLKSVTSPDNVSLSFGLASPM